MSDSRNLPRKKCREGQFEHDEMLKAGRADRLRRIYKFIARRQAGKPRWPVAAAVRPVIPLPTQTSARATPEPRSCSIPYYGRPESKFVFPKQSNN